MAEPFDRLKAALADRYTIEREIGAGGMATVYLAHDVKHDRKVAIKVLRPELTAVLGAERFVQEIKTTANLQHPNILPLFDSGEADGFLYYVMPYVEGETLREKLNRETQLGIEEAVKITTEVADALDYAHRNNVIHRDIKPENILLHDGRPTVADFGIALAVSAAAGGRMTETGLSLGTPHYMSPEQATAEKDLTNRSDIYSLGAVLYEMLTGDPPHTGSSAQQIIMKIVTDDARPVTELRKSVPPNVAAAVAKALEKLPADRFRTAAMFAEALTDVRLVPSRSNRVLPSRFTWAHMPQLRSRAPTFSLVILTAVVVWVLRPFMDPPDTAPGTRFTIPVPTGHEMLFSESSRLAVSPDGRMVAYVTDHRLHTRRLERFDSEVLAGTEGAEVPFFSPDGAWIGFLQDGTLKKVPSGGGPVLEITGAAAGSSFMAGATWHESGVIAYSPLSGSAGVWMINAEGGKPSRITVPVEEASHTWPQLLDDGQLLMYGVTGRTSLWSDAKIFLHDLRTGERTLVVEGGAYGRYAATGHVVYVDGSGTVFAKRFDLAGRTATGPSFIVEEGVRVAIWAGGAASLAISDAGAAAFVRGSNRSSYLLEWIDRQGRRLGSLETLPTNGAVRLSPDGMLLATWLSHPSNADVWLLDLTTGDRQRLPDDPGWEWFPVWSPDGRRIAHTRSGEQPWYSIQVTDIDSARVSRSIASSDYEMWPWSWSPNERSLLVAESSELGARDIYALKVDGMNERMVLAGTDADEYTPTFSPDGRTVAYRADAEVFVVSFPDTTIRRQVTPDGGHSPRWSPVGGELLYWKSDTLMAVDISGANRFIGTPKPLFVASDVVSLEDVMYDVASDGERFLVQVKNPSASARQIHVVTNWLDELRSREGR